MIEEGGRLLRQQEEAPKGIIRSPLFETMEIIQRQKKKKRRCISKIQEGRCPFCLEGGGIIMISPFSFLRGLILVGDAGRREDGGCFGF